MPAGIPSATPLDSLVAQYFKVQVEGVIIASFQEAADASNDLWNWHKAALDGDIINARKNGSIIQYDFVFGEVARYNFFDAWISKFEATGMKAGDNSPAVESVTIVCERLEKVGA